MNDLRGSGLAVADFDFDLPAELIAQHPPAERGQSRMLAMDRASGELRDTRFSEFPCESDYSSDDNTVAEFQLSDSIAFQKSPAMNATR